MMGRDAIISSHRFTNMNRIHIQERSEDADEQSKLDDRDTPGSPSLGAAGRGIPQVQYLQVHVCVDKFRFVHMTSHGPAAC